MGLIYTQTVSFMYGTRLYFILHRLRTAQQCLWKPSARTFVSTMCWMKRSVLLEANSQGCIKGGAYYLLLVSNPYWYSSSHSCLTYRSLRCVRIKLELGIEMWNLGTVKSITSLFAPTISNICSQYFEHWTMMIILLL